MQFCRWYKIILLYPLGIRQSHDSAKKVHHTVLFIDRSLLREYNNILVFVIIVQQYSIVYT